MGIGDFLKGNNKRPQAGEKDRRLPLDSHWSIVCDTVEEVRELNIKVLDNRQPVIAAPLEGRKAVGLLLQEGVFSFVYIIGEDGEALTFYPMPAGKRHRMVFTGAPAFDPAFEGNIGVAMADAGFKVFDPLYFRNHGAYEAGKNYDVALSGIAYFLKPAGDDKIKDKYGREVSMKGMAGFLPSSDRPADYEFRSPVKKIENVIINGKQLLRLTLHLFYLTGKNAAYGDVDYYLYVRRDRLSGYTPAVGDDVTGVMWLQGYLV